MAFSALPYDEIRMALPPGDHPMTFAALRESWLVVGPSGRKDWDRHRRSQLLTNFEVLARQLWSVGIAEVYLGGSFVECKGCPADIDGYFVCDREDFKSRRLHRSLNAIAPIRVWTWRKEHRRPSQSGELKLPMWHNYQVDLYPDYGQLATPPGASTAAPIGFAALYRRTRDHHQPRGIVRVVPTADVLARERQAVDVAP